MITGVGSDNILRRYDIENRTLVYQYNGWGALSIDISTDQNYIVGGGGSGFGLYRSKLVGITENPIQNKDVLIYPNPSTGIANISFNNSFSGNYKVEIFNNSGGLINQLFDGFLDSGIVNFKWNTITFPNGIYFCRFTGINTKLTYKIIVNK